jgi:hypothetical protein
MSDNKQAMKITLQVDWGVGPFWVAIGDSIQDDYLPDEVNDIVPLSKELIQAVAAWDEKFQTTFNDKVPQDSGILDPAEEKRFDEEGLDLARRIKREVPADVTVEYASVGGSASTV